MGYRSEQRLPLAGGWAGVVTVRSLGSLRGDENVLLRLDLGSGYEGGHVS